MLPILATSVVGLVVVLVFLGLIVWLVYSKGAALPAFFKWLIYAVCAIVGLLLVLDAFGVLSEVRSIQVPKI